MNIFVLDRNIIRAAQYHCDAHVVKMILETAQILCTVRFLYGLSAPYKPTHIHHPCVKWAAKNIINYYWLLKLGIELGREYTYRFNKHHKSVDIIMWCLIHMIDFKDMPGPNPFTFTLNTPKHFALAMPDIYKTDNEVQAYRNYYIGAKQHLFKWTKREVPEWITIQRTLNTS